VTSPLLPDASFSSTRRVLSGPAPTTSKTCIHRVPLHLFYKPANARSVQNRPLFLHPRLRPRRLWAAARLSLLPLGKSFAAGCVLGSTYAVASDTSASLPVAPPSELSPIREVSLNALASTFVPRTPCFPQAEVARSSPKNGAERGFEDLIAILGELLANGGSTPRISTVFSLWRDKKSDTFETVNATRFRAHLQRAVSAGIVAVEQRKDGDGWVTLRRQREADPKNPQHALSQHPVSQSRGSIRAPNDLRVSENLEPQSFTVGQRAPRKNPSIYEDAGVATIRTTGTPPILAANAPPSFAPLVELLKSKQLTSGQPISFSEVFAHLVSTLGYGDFVSLCTSVPGVTTFSEYIDAAVASGLVSLVGGTGASESALVSLRDAGLAQGTGQRSPDSPSRVPATPPPSLPPFLPRSCSGVYKGTSKHAGPSRRSRRSSRR